MEVNDKRLACVDDALTCVGLSDENYSKSRCENGGRKKSIEMRIRTKGRIDEYLCGIGDVNREGSEADFRFVLEDEGCT